MRTIEEYMKLPYKVEVIPDMDEGGFVVSIPELTGCITCGETMETAISNLNDAKKASVLMSSNISLPIKSCFMVSVSSSVISSSQCSYLSAARFRISSKVFSKFTFVLFSI